MAQSHLTRRNLLKTTAAATIGLPYMLTSSALGNAEKAPASERVVLGYLGAGNRGKELLDGFLECKTAQNVAVADCWRDRREAAAAKMNGKAYADFRELLARPDIDAVIIATPEHWHVALAMAAARAGKDVYLEKPLGISIQEGLACLKLFRGNKRVFQYGTQQRSSSHCRFGCELVRSGKIGKVHTIEVLAPEGQAGGSTVTAPVPAELNYDMWLGPAPVKEYTPDRCKVPGTYWIYDYSIGYLGGWGAHPLDIMVWGSDADLAGPMTVEGTGVIPDKGLYDTVIHWDVKVQMSDVRMTFKAGGGDIAKFIGSEGWISISRSAITAEPKSLLETKLGPGDVHLPVSARHDQNFLDAVKSRKTAVSSVDDAVRSDIISHLSDIAIRTKRKITWDPKKQTIVGDDDAAKMLSRPVRTAWKL
jgi:hypothetical protein